MVNAGSHYHDVLLGSVGVLQQFTEVIEVTRVADGDQHVAGPHLHLFSIDKWLLGDAELLAHLVIGPALPMGNLLGNRKYAEQEEGEADAGDSG